MDKLISIVLPVYNGERFLRESIDSIRRQTYTGWELIIVDDCSSDATPDIAKEYASADSRIHYYRNEVNLKLPRTLNKGFSLARGDYLTWTSDDNRFQHQALEKMLNKLLSDPEAQVVYAAYQLIDEKGNTTGQIYADEYPNKHILGENVIGSCFMFTRKAYETTGEYDPELFLVEDYDYWQRMLMQYKAVGIRETLYDYRMHGSSLTSTKNEKRFGELLEYMLLKNRPGFGKIDAEAEYHFYRTLVRAREKQGGENPYRFRYLWSCVKCFIRHPYRYHLM